MDKDKILQLIKQAEYRSHFFMELAKAENPAPWLETLNKEGYFSPDKSPEPIEDKDKKGLFSIPRWDVLGFLENVSKQNKKNPNQQITTKLLGIIDKYIKFQKDATKRIDNYVTDWVFIKIISNLPIQEITLDHIDFVKIALESKWDTTLIRSYVGKVLLPYLLDHNPKNHVLSLFKIIIDYYGKKDTGQDEYWFNDLLKKNKVRIINLYDEEIIKMIMEKIEEITQEKRDSFNFVWIPAIEDHEQTSFPERYECQLVRLLRDSVIKLELEKSKEIAEKLSKKDHVIFRRIFLHIIDVKYVHLKALFWDMERNPLEEYELTHEVYMLLKNNCSQFTKEEITRLISWIEEKTHIIPEDIKDDEEKKKELIAYRKKKWYSALLGCTDSRIQEKYSENDKIKPTPIEHPEFLTWHETFVGEKVPDELDVVFNKPNKEIAEYLKEFIEDRDPRTPSKRGIADKLSSAVFENHKKFSLELIPFLEVDEIYQHALLRGFKDLCKKNKEFDWKNVLNFISNIIVKDDFWEKVYEDFNLRDWIVSDGASLIEEGTKENYYSFDNSLIQKAKEILLILGKKSQAELFRSDDIVSAVLNSVKGSIYSAMVWLSFKIDRAGTKKWDKEIKEFFTEQLKNPSDELLVTIGEYLPQLNTLNSEWIDNHFDVIFNKEDILKWKSTMTGYLYYSDKLYKDIYLKLSKHDDYKKAIFNVLDNKPAEQKLVQNICVAYINDLEDLANADSSISILIHNMNPNQIDEIIRFFWTLRKEELDENIKNKIKPLWKEILGVCSQEKDKNPNFYETLSKLPEWLVLIDKIDDEIYTMVNESVKHIKNAYDTWFLVESLSKHVTTTPNYAGGILLCLLENNIYPDYKQENIIEIVSELYAHSESDIANKICNLYLSKGFYFLKAIFDKNQSASQKEAPK